MPPSRRAIADGYQLLNELGAVDDDNELTTMGAELGVGKCGSQCAPILHRALGEVAPVGHLPFVVGLDEHAGGEPVQGCGPMPFGWSGAPEPPMRV